jgi:hypothetical protein
MDATLLARVSGTDPSLVDSEQIRQIMQTPDLLSIYQKLQEEDDRRQRRLERNRASARVRREKKKSMVETYEGEVSKLENSLNLLKNHAFGAGHPQDLQSALGTLNHSQLCGLLWSLIFNLSLAYYRLQWGRAFASRGHVQGRQDGVAGPHPRPAPAKHHSCEFPFL